MSESMQFGELLLQYTCTFLPRWNDRKSGVRPDVAFWHPIAPPGFKALGSIAVPDYNDANYRFAALCVARSFESSSALRAPTGYSLVWFDKGSGAKLDGSCWRPLAPRGYVALGHVFASGYDVPSLDDMVCVREDMVAGGAYGSAKLWSYHHTHLYSAGFSAWQVEPPEQYVDRSRALIAVNSFVGVDNQDKQPDSNSAKCLCLRLPAEAGYTPTPPVLTSKVKPAEETERQVDHSVWIPFTGVRDPGGPSLADKVARTPFYRLQREVWYDQLLFCDNATDLTQHLEQAETVGVTTSQSQTFSRTTGVSVTAETGISFLGSGGSVSATVSVELGYETSKGIDKFRQKTVTAGLETPAGFAAVMWKAMYAFRVVRSDGSVVSDEELDFSVEGFYHSQFPAHLPGQPQALFFELPQIAEHIPA